MRALQELCYDLEQVTSYISVELWIENIETLCSLGLFQYLIVYVKRNDEFLRKNGALDARDSDVWPFRYLNRNEILL